MKPFISIYSKNKKNEKPDKLFHKPVNINKIKYKKNQNEKNTNLTFFS